MQPPTITGAIDHAVPIAYRYSRDLGGAGCGLRRRAFGLEAFGDVRAFEEKISLKSPAQWEMLFI
jgi:hypothetical protein